MHTFYVTAGQLDKEDARHASRVLRLKAGDEITALSDGARYRARIAQLTDNPAPVELLQALPANESPLSITLYQGLPKAEKLEFLAQKLTELGVARLTRVRMARSVAKGEGDRRAERLERIAREAVKQCRRARVMEISPVLSWKEALSDMAKREVMIVPWEDASSTRMRDLFAAFPQARDIGILVGPEGGISSEEISECPARPVPLGPRILRAETAAVTAAALAMGLWGDV